MYLEDGTFVETMFPVLVKQSNESKLGDMKSWCEAIMGPEYEVNPTGSCIFNWFHFFASGNQDGFKFSKPEMRDLFILRWM